LKAVACYVYTAEFACLHPKEGMSGWFGENKSWLAFTQSGYSFCPPRKKK